MAGEQFSALSKVGLQYIIDHRDIEVGAVIPRKITR